MPLIWQYWSLRSSVFASQRRPLTTEFSFSLPLSVLVLEATFRLTPQYVWNSFLKFVNIVRWSLHINWLPIESPLSSGHAFNLSTSWRGHFIGHRIWVYSVRTYIWDVSSVIYTFLESQNVFSQRMVLLLPTQTLWLWNFHQGRHADIMPLIVLLRGRRRRETTSSL